MNRLPRHRFHQALQAGLPVQRRSHPPSDADAWTASLVWVLTFDTEGHCVAREFRPASSTGELQGEVWTSSARERDPDTSLQYHRHRSYDPSLGRWATEDPRAFLTNASEPTDP